MHYLLAFCTSENQLDEQQLQKDGILKNEPLPNDAQGSEKCETEDRTLDKDPSAISLKELFVLLCCRDSLHIYPAKSVVQVCLKFLIFPFLYVFYL